ncbi:hypothetical protein B0H12DRAFT_1229030 [Mycena haematopus]|nr:hypothetical protein B0H12DRAFT_1229030 [Mycena haematopus]
MTDGLLSFAFVIYCFSPRTDVCLGETTITATSLLDSYSVPLCDLVLPAGRKTLLRSLVEAHHEEAGFDNFVKVAGLLSICLVHLELTDVFLEPRSLDDLERNAKVVVLGSLRHVVYYREILFLMMNRAQAFDEAFLSRIHVVLHSSELSAESQSRAQV